MQIRLFENLSNIEQARLLGKLEKVNYPADTTIFNEGDTGEWMYILVKGMIHIFVSSTDAKEQLIGVVHEGDTFGEMALLTGEPRSATVRTSTEAQVYILDQHVFKELIQTHAAVANYFTQLLCKRLAANNEQLGQVKKEQQQLVSSTLDSLHPSIKEIILHAVRLPNPAEISFLATYLDQPTLRDRLHQELRNTQIAWLDSNRLHIQLSLMPILLDISARTIDDSRIKYLYEAAIAYYLNNHQRGQAIEIYAVLEDWQTIFTLIEDDQHLIEETITWTEAMKVLDKCPDDYLFKPEHFSTLSKYLTDKLNHETASGFSRLELNLEIRAGSYSSVQLTILYEFMAEFSDRLNFPNKALEYLQMAQAIGQHKQHSLPKGQNYEQAKRSYYHSKSIESAQSKQSILWTHGLIPVVISALGMAIILLFWLLTPFEGLEREAMIFLGLTAAAVLFWVTDIIPDYLVSLLMCMCWVLFGLVQPEMALSGFSSTTWFFIIFVLILGAAVSTSGLMYRCSLYMLKIFPRTYRGQLVGLALASIVMNPLIPSGMTKAVLSTPIAMDISESLGFRKHSKGSAGLVLGTFLLFVYMNPFFLTAGVTNFLAIGLVPNYEFSFLSWMWYALPALILYTIAVLAVIFFTFRPESSEGKAKLTDKLLNEQLQVLGKPSRHERTIVIVLISVIALLITQNIHGLPGVWVLLGGWVVLVLSKALHSATIRNAVDLPALLHIGVAIGFAQVSAEVGATNWMADQLHTIVEPFTFSPYVFLPVLAGFIILIGFFVSGLPAIILLVVSLLPLFEQLGYDPWLLVFVVLLSTEPFFISYQSEVYLSTYYATEGKSFSHQQGRKVAIWYAFIVLFILFCSVPFWQMIGLI